MSAQCCVQMSYKRLNTNIKRCRLKCDHSGSRISNKRLQVPSPANSEMPFISKEQLLKLRCCRKICQISRLTRKKPNSGIKKINKQISGTFKGIDKIRDNKNDEDFYAKFSMKPEATPVAQRPRPAAYYLQEPLKKTLEQYLKEGIFKQVPEGKPLTWCSSLVVQPKPKFYGTPKEDPEPHMIRASVDLRIPNQYMERHRITQGTLIEEFTYKFHDCTVFSKLDMRQGYHQLLLDPEFRKVARFSTPWGNLRPERLIF